MTTRTHIHRVTLPLPEHLQPQTQAEREDLAGSIGAWCKAQTAAVIAAAASQNPDGEPMAVTFVGVSSRAVASAEGAAFPDSATPLEAVALRRHRFVWSAYYDVEIDREAAPVEVPAREVADAMFPEGKHE